MKLNVRFGPNGLLTVGLVLAGLLAQAEAAMVESSGGASAGQISIENGIARETKSIEFAQAKSGSAQVGRPSRPYAEMDYGPFLTASVEVAKDNIAYKGIALRLDEGEGGVSEGGAFVVFDTDLMRYAAGWTGPGFIDWKGIAFDGEHGVHSAMVGHPVFTSPVAPGWAHPDSASFADPRLGGLDQKPYGPLPRNWSHYKGLHLHGHKVILSYTVGNTEVLEWPALERHGQLKVFTRTLAIGKSARDLTLEICAIENGPARVHSLETLALEKTEARATGAFAVLPRTDQAGNAVTAVACVGGEPMMKWDFESKSDLRLRIPASQTPVLLKVLITETPPESLAQFAALARASARPVDLADLTQGGPARWKQELTTRVERSRADGPYVIDTLMLPTPNPWRSWMRLGGFDFFEGGQRAALCTWQGDVWLVEGLGSNPEKLVWRRMASGLFQPLGLKIVDGKIYVTCRDQITVLHDLNGDGEADFYENFNNDAQVTEHFHEFAMDLQTDTDGNFYYTKAARHAKEPLVPQHGTLIKVTKDGQKSEILANGFRAPNGVCVNPDGSFVVSDQEGHWTPMNRINWVTQGGFYGNMWSYAPGRREDDDEPPLCWIHKNMDRSPAQQLWVTSERWGPIRGALLSLSYGTGRIWNVLHENSGAMRQGGIVRLPLPELSTGIMRGRFNPGDGQLYVCGLFGWAGNKTLPGGFYRVRYTEKPVHVPMNLSATVDGVMITFTNPLDPTSAGDPQNYSVARWNYQRSANYGSADYKVSDGTKGRDSIEVTGVKVSQDGRSVFLQIPDMRTCMQMEIQFDVVAADGTRISQVIGSTVNFLR